MFFEGISEPIEQSFSLPAVMRLLLTEQRQSFLRSELVEPASPPGPAFKHSMQIGACHHATSVSDAFDPAQLRLTAELLAGGRCCGEAMVQFKALQLDPVAPEGP